jgi:predicted N-acetyltransferase YhbS
MDEKTWKSWYTGTPAGDAWVLVAEEESGKIVGQFVFMPSRILVNGREVKAARPSAPIFSRSLRQFPTLVNAMYLAGVQAVRDSGAELVYILPNPKWRRFAERFGERPIIGSYPLHTLPLAGTSGD